MKEGREEKNPQESDPHFPMLPQPGRSMASGASLPSLDTQVNHPKRKPRNRGECRTAVLPNSVNLLALHCKHAPSSPAEQIPRRNPQGGGTSAHGTGGGGQDRGPRAAGSLSGRAGGHGLRATSEGREAWRARQNGEAGGPRGGRSWRPPGVGDSVGAVPRGRGLASSGGPRSRTMRTKGNGRHSRLAGCTGW